MVRLFQLSCSFALGGLRPRRDAGGRTAALRVEMLEERNLLSSCGQGNIALDELAGHFSTEQVANHPPVVRLLGEEVRGATIITHGFQIRAGAGDSLLGLAEAIHSRAGGWLINYDVSGQGGSGCFVEDLHHDNHGDGDSLNEVVLLFDWAAEANESSNGWGEAAGDALFSMLVAMKLVQPGTGTSVPLHFIGHSFGTAVTSEVVERLAYFDITVDHLTYLDPHDFDQGLHFNTQQELWKLGKPHDSSRTSMNSYGASVWNNVDFADAYYQTRGVGCPLSEFVPEGRPIPGAINYWLDSELPPLPLLTGPCALLGGPYSGGDSDHSFVWNGFYRDTVNDLASSRGYAYSRIADLQARPAALPFDPGPIKETEGEQNELQAPNRPSYLDSLVSFYSNSLNHKWSSSSLVKRETGIPNDEGLQALGLNNKDEVVKGRWSPAWNPLAVTGDGGNIVNGDFRVGPLNPFKLIRPGWSHHGGGGAGLIATSNLMLGRIGPSAVVFGSRTHNWFYVPSNATHVTFDLQRIDLFPPNLIHVQLDPVAEELQARVWSIPGRVLSRDREPQYVPIPEHLRGQVITLTFEVDGLALLGAGVRIDNVRLLGVPIVAAPSSSIVQVIDRSGSMGGQPLDDAKAAAKIFVELMNPGDKIGIVSYDAGRSLRYQGAATALTVCLERR